MKATKLYSEDELLFVKSNCTMIQSELTSHLNAKFGRDFEVEQINGLRKRKGWKTGRTGCYEKGSIPFNKGKKMDGPRSKTIFKKGHRPANHMPVGSHRVNGDGYIDVKIAEGKKKWYAKHRLVWEMHYGKIERNNIIRFKDGNRFNCAIDNLELFTRSENARLNQMKVNDMHDDIKPVAKTMVRIMVKASTLKMEKNK